MSNKTSKLIRQGSTGKGKAQAHIVSVRFSTEDEKEEIENNAREAGFGTGKQSGISRYIKSLIWGHKPSSIFDQEVMIELCKLHGAIGKIGGLMKLAISKGEGRENMQVYIREILATQKEVKNLIKEIREGQYLSKN